MKVLYINACVREESRTKKLADHLIRNLEIQFHEKAHRNNQEEFEVCEIILENEGLKPLDGTGLEKRNAAVAAGDYSAPVFGYAKKLLDADAIVIAAPYWDLSFPASLKVFFENVTVDGLTFHYTEEGFPEGFCKAERLYYVTTAGGPVVSDEYGFGYVRDIAKFYYGIPEAVQFKAEYLDVIGADVDGIMMKAKKQIDSYCE
jgi:FMN-dependent NADH-azoreductase